jgi:hypothetical protein
LFEAPSSPRWIASRHSVLSLISCVAAVAAAGLAGAQVTTFGGNAQHTNLYSPAAQDINQVKWQTSIDTSNSGQFAHYGAPLITADNTLITPVMISLSAFQISAFDGASGAGKYTLATDFIQPPYNWIPEYQPCLVGNRLYYAGAGGTIYYVDNANTSTPTAPTQLCFYGLSNYQANPGGFNGTVFVDTPITADSAGNIYFGFRVSGTAPIPLNTSKSGYAKVTPAGAGTYVLVDAMTSDANINRDSHNAAPALSNDESTLYVVAGNTSTRYYAYLVALNTADLSTKSEVFLRDPRNGNPGGLLDDGTSSPMVAPDGDVFMGVFGNPYNGSRGFLGHYSGDLSVTKPYGGFGWDYTAGIVPASMVPSYHGTSSYLVFCKYNNYTGTGVDDGDGVNRVAVLDPNALQTDIHPSSSGLQIMREVQTMIGPTPDQFNPSVPNAVHEMCVNATCVNQATNSVFFNSEDGHAYRWNLATNQMTQGLALTPGFGEPYVPSVIGPDGTVFTLNGGLLFAMGGLGNVKLTVDSSEPDTETAVLGDAITFTANVTSGSGTPTGTVTFSDMTYNGFTPVTTPLGAAVIDANGHASVTTAALTAGGPYLGNHFITASYSGDPQFGPGSMLLVQKVHAYATSTALNAVSNPSPYGQPVVLTATVTGPPGVGEPTGQVTYMDGDQVIGQVPVDGSGTSTFTANGLTAGSHDLSATYVSDTNFARSIGHTTLIISEGTAVTVSGSPNPSVFNNPVTFTMTVTALNSAAGTPTGTVTLKEGTFVWDTATVDSTGQHLFTTSSLSVGTHTLTVEFTGTNGWGNSSGQTTQDVHEDTTTSLGSSPNPSTVGQSVTFTATVASVYSPAGTPTGSVAFNEGATTLATVNVNGSGQAAFSTTTLSSGNHTITASFTGTGGYQNSSGQATQTVSGATTTSVASSLNPSVKGQSVTFTATVVPSGTGAGVPTGSVVFKNGTTALGTVTVDGTGHAAFSTSTLSVATHKITAVFTGTGGWGNSTSPILSQVVVADTTPPTVPQGVAAVSGPGSGQITISWSPSTDPDDAVKDYQVFRSSTLNGSYTRIKTVTGTSYADKPGHGAVRFYYVTAVDTHGNTSAPSAKVSAAGL